MTRPQDQCDTGSPHSRAVPPWWVLVGGLAVIGVGGALIAGIADDSESSAEAAPPSASTAAPSAAPPTTVSPPAPSSTVSQAPTIVPTPTAADGTSTSVDFVMPDVVGMDRQSAQDLVQTNGVFYSVSHDLLGRRNQLLDSNWVVCDQSVAPGDRVTGDVEGQLDFGVVKRGESCP